MGRATTPFKKNETFSAALSPCEAFRRSYWSAVGDASLPFPPHLSQPKGPPSCSLLQPSQSGILGGLGLVNCPFLYYYALVGRRIPPVLGAAYHASYGVVYSSVLEPGVLRTPYIIARLVGAYFVHHQSSKVLCSYLSPNLP